MKHQWLSGALAVQLDEAELATLIEFLGHCAANGVPEFEDTICGTGTAGSRALIKRATEKLQDAAVRLQDDLYADDRRIGPRALGVKS